MVLNQKITANPQHLLLLLIFNLILSCSNSDTISIHKRIEKNTHDHYDSLVTLRRHFHQYPELAGNEIRSSRIIAEYLTNLGLEVKTGISGYGVVGILKGDGNGKNIAWRADMDALSNDYLDDVPYKSKITGVQHGCGHDIHMTIGLGIATVLAKHKSKLKGSVYFIFQPQEETFAGAKSMVQSAVILNNNIDEIYALHVTALPVGHMLVKPNEVFAYQKRIQMTFQNTLSKKELKTLFDSIRHKIMRQKEGSNPWNIQEAFDTDAGITHPETGFRDYRFLEESFILEEEDNVIRLSANLYETNKSKLTEILSEIEGIITQSEFNSALMDLSYIQENPTVLNDENLTEQATILLNALYGEHTLGIAYGQIPYFNDDFIYFQQNIPGVYFLLGGSNPEKGINALNHSPHFKVDEACMKTGVASFSSLILERANSQ